MSYPNWIFSMFCFIGFLMTTIPLPWHLEAWNTGTCLYMIWTSLACLNQFINSILFNGTAVNVAPVFCDISSRFMVGASVAIPASSLCINRRLYHIASVSTVTVTRAEKRRAILTDLAIGLGLPVLEMILQYIPQGHRFNIYEDIGCYPFTYNTWVAYPLVYCWPIAIGLVSAVYCVLSIIAFNKRRAQFKELLSGNNNLSPNRYFRLMALAGIELLCTVPLGIYAVYLDIAAGIQPWISWADTHSFFDRADQWPAVIWRSYPVMAMSLEFRWVNVVCAIVFFAFFGFADEARKNYRLAYTSIAKRVGLSTGSMSSGLTSSVGFKSKPNLSSTGTNTLPVMVQRETTTRRDSFDSFSDLSIADVGGALAVDEKEKTEVPELNLDTVAFADVGGMLADYKAPYSPTVLSSASSSSGSSRASLDASPPAYPESPVSRSEAVIEISSARNSVMRTSTDSLPLPPHAAAASHSASNDPANMV